MPDERFPADNSPQWEDDPDGLEVPPSVTFMEMMRQAAAKSAKPTPDPAEQLFRRKVQSAPPPTEPTPMPAPAPAQAPTSTVATVVTEPPLTDPAKPAEDAQAAAREAAIEEQRIQRIKRRQARRRRQTVGVLGGMVRTFLGVGVAAGLLATIFTWWTPSQFLTDEVKTELSIAQATSQVTLVPTGLPTPNWLRRIGIVAGHRGPQVPPDPGAVCPDGLTEAEINFAVAQAVVRNLSARGYAVDLLDEFDPRLDNYQAAVLVSIHANTCQEWPGEIVSGFLVSAAAARVSASGNDEVLVSCIARYYEQATGLLRREGVTVDMTDYHTFREIHPSTPASIIELGFLLADRPILTGKQDAMSSGITDGILCFLEPNQPPPTYVPGA
jgi:N-acetylmuramoyl-L-alanine amidase